MFWIFALPGTGKTHLRKQHHNVVDTDDALRLLYGGHSKDVWVDHGDDLKIALKKVHKLVRMLAGNYQFSVAVSNLHGISDLVSADDSVACYYAPNDYIDHLHICGRTDILEKFSIDELKSWAADYVKHPASTHVVLRPGQYLGDSEIVLQGVNK